MKKIVLLVALMTTFAMSGAFAQTYRIEEEFGDFDFSGDILPKKFSSNGETMLGARDWENKTLKLYNSQFQCVKTFQYPDSYEFINYYDLDENNHSDIDIPVTQTLFNNDEEYEFLQWGYNESGWTTSLSIVSGNHTISTISASSGHIFTSYVNLIKFNNEYYLFLVEGVLNGNGKGPGYDVTGSVFYHINRSSVTAVLEPVDVDFPMNVFPSVAHRSQPITVQLGEGNNASEVSVIDATGRTVQRVAIQPGQREVVIPAATLPRGLNVVNARNAQSQASYKIIVR